MWHWKIVKLADKAKFQAVKISDVQPIYHMKKLSPEHRKKLNYLQVQVICLFCSSHIDFQIDLICDFRHRLEHAGLSVQFVKDLKSR